MRNLNGNNCDKITSEIAHVCVCVRRWWVRAEWCVCEGERREEETDEGIAMELGTRGRKRKCEASLPSSPTSPPPPPQSPLSPPWLLLLFSTPTLRSRPFLPTGGK